MKFKINDSVIFIKATSIEDVFLVGKIGKVITIGKNNSIGVKFINALTYMKDRESNSCFLSFDYFDTCKNAILDKLKEDSNYEIYEDDEELKIIDKRFGIKGKKGLVVARVCKYINRIFKCNSSNIKKINNKWDRESL